ncbi:unnamed protein product [Heterosigma akashiwo]|uniref:K Homology domain-containing protein n=2 Tax=Heterosigma akashiwo TaxID=2829 RepID=A0A6V3BSU8_HETAK|mmetsp:Transcript_26307/g.45936  ORF Transcript_26307/g.45936 Transcript_26307/m.45936 type:complete len:165 (-) Transcript_26307:346-840(-)
MTNHPEMRSGGDMYGARNPVMGGGMGGGGTTTVHASGANYASSSSSMPQRIGEPVEDEQDGINWMCKTSDGVELSVFPTILMHLVGRGGSKIREVSDSVVGATIKAQGRDTVTPDQTDRKIFIYGTPQGVEQGVQVLRNFVEELFTNHPEMRHGQEMFGKRGRF